MVIYIYIHDLTRRNFGGKKFWRITKVADHKSDVISRITKILNLGGNLIWRITQTLNFGRSKETFFQKYPDKVKSTTKGQMYC